MLSGMGLLIGLLGVLAAGAFLVGGDDGSSETTGAEGQPPEDLPDNVTDSYRSDTGDGSGFNVDIAYEGDGWSEDVKDQINEAAELFSDIVLEDQSAENVAGYGTIDDQLIQASIRDQVDFAQVDPTFGVEGGTVALGGSFFTGGGDPAINGYLIFDEPDFDTLVQDANLTSVAFHEFMHAVGFGIHQLNNSTWAQNLTTNSDGDLVYRSELSDAILGGTENYANGILVANDRTHWDGDIYGNEIMTPTIDPDESQYIGIQTLIFLEDAGFDTIIDNPLDPDDMSGNISGPLADLRLSI